MEHIDIPPGEIHAPHNWEFANTGERTAAVVTDASLIGRLALQLDTRAYWRLESVVPAAWESFKSEPFAHQHGIDDVGGLQEIIDEIKAAGSAAELIEAHVEATDPHPQYATDSAVAEALAALVGSVPGTLNTLSELAAALANDPNFATTIATALAGKVDKTAVIPLAKGGTGAIDAAGARANLGADFLAPLTNDEVSITGATTLTTAAFGKMHVCSGATADYAVTLPASASNEGKALEFRMAPGLTKLVTIKAASGDDIDGAPERVMWTHEAARLLCRAGGWTKDGGKTIPLGATMRIAALPEAGGVAQTLPRAVMTKILLNQRDSGRADMCDIPNSRMRVLRGGLYAVSTLGYFGSGVTYTRTIVGAYANGTQLFSGESATSKPTNFSWCQPEGRVELNAGDLLELVLYQDNVELLDNYIFGVASGSSNILSVMEIPAW